MTGWLCSGLVPAPSGSAQFEPRRLTSSSKAMGGFSLLVECEYNISPAQKRIKLKDRKQQFATLTPDTLGK